MLHQPVSTFQPSTPAKAPPATAPFDPKHFISRARELGLIIFPSIFLDGRRTYGLTTPGQKGFSSRNLSINEEFAAAIEATPDAKTQIFDALCADYGVDADASDFNDRVGELCRREDLRRQSDRPLLKLCRGARAILLEDQRLEEANSEATDAFMAVAKPPRPTQPSDLSGPYHHLSSGELREILSTLRAIPAQERTAVTKGVLANGLLAAYARDVLAWERAVRALEDVHGVTAAGKAADRATKRSRTIIAKIAATPATTSVGMAAKCQVMKACRATGWGLHDEFEDLALSIFEDGALCGEQLQPTARPRSSEPTQHVHH